MADTDQSSARTAGPRFAKIFRQNAAFVWRTLRRHGVSDSELEDKCQDVFVVVHRKLPEFEGRSSVRTWLYGICANVASTHRRRAQVRRERTTAEPPEQTVPPQQAVAFEHKNQLRILDDILSDLSPEKREVFVLYEIEEMTMEEVAEVLACPRGTAFSRLYAARREIDAAIGKLKGRERIV